MRYDIPFNDTCPRSWRSTELCLSKDLYAVEIGYNKVPRGLKQIAKREVFILHYITEGKGRFMGKSFDFEYAYLVHPGELEIFEAEQNFCYKTYWIMFCGNGAKKLLKDMGLPEHNGVFKFKNNAECAKVLHRALFDANPTNGLEEYLLMQSALYKILSFHTNGLKKEECTATAERVKNFIDRNWQKDLKLDVLAHEMNYSRSHLYKIFKKTYGTSPKEYLVDLRIKKSKDILSDKAADMSVSEAAYAVGYKNPLYFSRLFHKKTGLSPTEYKKSV